MRPESLSHRIVAEALGTGLLVATVVGSGIMAERLAGGNAAIALLGNTIPTGAILVVLILALGPLSGAHFNPAVSLVVVVIRAGADGRGVHGPASHDLAARFEDRGPRRARQEPVIERARADRRPET